MTVDRLKWYAQSVALGCMIMWTIITYDIMAAGSVVLYEPNKAIITVELVMCATGAFSFIYLMYKKR